MKSRAVVVGFEVTPPKYARVVLAVQERIAGGTYAPGVMLPSENRLAGEFSVSRPTIVKALDILRNEGWIETRQGSGSFVRGRPSLADTQRSHTGKEHADAIETESSTDLNHVGPAPVPPRVAAVLGLDPGTRAFLRRRLVRDQDGTPSELVSAWFPLDLVKGTDLDSADLLSEGVARHLQRRRGIRFDHVVERISARQPSADEQRLLDMPAEVPVIVLLAVVYDANERPLEVIDAVLPADRHELEDAYPFA
jgi:DNA-binding GntR family transcriptional regulator